MAQLILTFQDLYNEVLKFIGTYKSGSPETADSDNAKFIVNRAYARLLGWADWTFLYRWDKLLTKDTEWQYELPTSFSCLVNDKFFFDADETFAPTESRSGADIITLRTDNDWSSWPYHHAIVAGRYDKEAGQRWEAWFYPTPDTTYPLWYFYRIMPQKLVETTDFPIGGAEASDAVLQLSLAYAEAYKEEKQDVQNAKVGEVLGPLKRLDDKRRPSCLGGMDGLKRVLRINKQSVDDIADNIV